MRDFRLTVGQWPVSDERDENLRRAEASLRQGAAEGAELCVLPEMFQTPYELGKMRARAESLEGPSLSAIRQLASELSLTVVAGSICEQRDKDFFNTSVVFGPDGAVLGVHRKVHLFDVQLETVRTQESLVLSPGEVPLVVDTPLCRLGVAICYDTRFPAVFQFFEKAGVEVVAIPAAFSQTTGTAHWHCLLRSRAVDYQIFLAAAGPAPNADSSYVTYGHSLVVDPWGTLLAEAGTGEETVGAKLEAETLTRVRRELPLIAHRRADLYRDWFSENS